VQEVNKENRAPKRTLDNKKDFIVVNFKRKYAIIIEDWNTTKKVVYF
jgi:hypothetical protein